MTLLAGAAVLCMALGAWIYWDNTAVGVTRHTVVSSRLPEAFHGFTIAQVSDLHNTEFGKDQEHLIEALEEIQPDMIAVTGDLIHSYTMDAALSFIRQAVRIAPVYYVTGNHESRSSRTMFELAAELENAGVHLLRDQSVVLERGGQSLFLAGLEDPAFFPEEKERPQQTARRLERVIGGDGYTILLSHRPELFDIYSASGVDLVLTGHAHGGQFRLPGLGGVFSPGQGMFPAYTEGVFSAENTVMVVSRGLGNSIFPFRLNNPPEVVAVTLKNK